MLAVFWAKGLAGKEKPEVMVMDESDREGGFLLLFLREEQPGGVVLRDAF